MNRIYRIVRNAAGKWIVTSELTRTGRASSGGSCAKHVLSAGIGMAAFFGAIDVAQASCSGVSPIVCSGDITTGGAVHGVHELTAGADNSDIKVNDDARIATSGDAAHAVYGQATGTGNVRIDAAGDFRTGGTGSHAINAEATTGSVSVINKGHVTTTGAGAYGIIANSTDGAIGIVNTGNVHVEGSGSGGIFAATKGGAITIESTGTINANGSDAGEGPHGIFAKVEGGPAGGSIGIKASGTLVTKGYDSSALRGSMYGSTSAGDVAIDYGGPGIETSGDWSRAVMGKSDGTGSIRIDTRGSGFIRTQGDNAYAVGGDHAGSGNVDISNSMTLETTGAAASGIVAYAAAGDISIDNSGDIATRGAGSDAIGAKAPAGDVAVAHSGRITTHGDGSTGIHAEGQRSVAVIAAGAISAGGDAAHAVAVKSAGTQAVTVEAAGELDGGRAGGSAISLQSLTDAATPVATVSNAGRIGALSDRVIATDFIEGSTLAIRNEAGGEITGFMTLGNGANTLDNAGTWNLRSLADSTGSGVRDTLRVAVTDFGSGDRNTVENSGTLALLGGTAGIVDPADLYNTGRAANTLASNGAVQGHLLGVSRFTNSGVIDLGRNGAVGDVLLISGGRVAGTPGSGTYVSGGTLKVDTVLNEGGANSQSDMFVVDRTSVGTAATGIQVNNVGGKGAVTQGRGIEVVRVLEHTYSADGAFALDGRVVAGAHEYFLYKSDGDGSWYLRNTVDKPSPEDEAELKVGEAVVSDGGTGTSESPSASVAGGAASPLYRPEVGAYLANQSAATGMFVHTLHDRLGELDFAESGRAGNDKPMAGWARLQGRKVDSEAGDNQLDLSTRSWMLQGGFELGRWNSGDNRLNAGLMLGTGSATTDVDSKLTGYSATGRVDGNSVGVYGTWYADASRPTGLYVDGWAQYGRYHNEVQGEGLVREKYTSSTRSASIEAGYAFEVGNDGRRVVYLEPQVQAIYTGYRADSHVEANGTVVQADEAGGFTSRVGARLYGRSLDTRKFVIQPFVAVNWWHADKGNAVWFNDIRMAQDLPKDRYEFKLGAQLDFGNGWTGWGQVGLQTGSNYRNLEGLVGAKYVW